MTRKRWCSNTAAYHARCCHIKSVSPVGNLTISGFLECIRKSIIYKKKFHFLIWFNQHPHARQNCHGIAWHDFIMSWVILLWQRFAPP